MSTKRLLVKQMVQPAISGKTDGPATAKKQSASEMVQ